MLLTAESAAVLLIDMQERLMPAIYDGAVVVSRAVRLAEAARLLNVPIAATEQYPAGLGPTVSPLADYPKIVLAKTTFSAVEDPGFPGLLPAGTSQIVVAGCEAHVCVLQTVLGLHEASITVCTFATQTLRDSPRLAHSIICAVAAA